MRSYGWTLIVAAASAWALLAATPVAKADENVAVLGIESAEGDLEFVRNLTGALRHAASQMPSWTVGSQEVSLEQMALAHGCSGDNARCLAQIAQTIGADRIIYGQVRRTTASATYNYALTLSIFTASSAEITRTITDTIPRIQSDIDQLRDRVRRYISELSGAGQNGTLRIMVNVEDAQVLVDGQLRGQTFDGVLALEVPAGRHRLEVVAGGHERFRGTFNVAQGDETALEVELLERGAATDAPPGDAGSMSPVEPGPEDGGGPGISVPGLALLGVGAVMFGLTIYSWVRIDSISSDPDYNEYRLHRVPRDNPETPGVDPYDVCEEARNHTPYNHAPYTAESMADDARRVLAVEDLCNEADALEVLQYVFLGLGTAAAAVGIYLIVDEASDSDGTTASIRFQPHIGMNRASLDATLRF